MENFIFLCMCYPPQSLKSSTVLQVSPIEKEYIKERERGVVIKEPKATAAAAVAESVQTEHIYYKVCVCLNRHCHFAS